MHIFFLSSPSHFPVFRFVCFVVSFPFHLVFKLFASFLFSCQLMGQARARVEGGEGVRDEANIYVNWHVGNKVAWDMEQMVFITQLQQTQLE